MGSTTLRLPDDKLKLLRAISGFENRAMSKIFEELVDDYIERHQETLEIVTNKQFMANLEESRKQFKEGKVHDLEDIMRKYDVED